MFSGTLRAIVNRPKIILASQSPRRKELLNLMGLDFLIIPSNYDEWLDDTHSAEDIAIELALGKAMIVANKYPDSVVIASDTIVTIDGKQLGKPKDVNDAYYLLKLLSGRENIITSSLAVIRKQDNIKLTGHDNVRVLFKPYNESAVRAYVGTGDAMDKAGAYGIQSGAAPLIDYIQGDFSTAMGLPTILLNEFLSKLGIESKPVKLDPPVKIIA